MKQELTFKSRARIVRTLGDRLVSGEVAAIIELVKNAYDADASTCHIKIDPQEDSITIEDDGHGMSIEDIQTKWVELGTDDKLRNTKSKSGKRKTLGDKGIGRLASAKLGNCLEIDSTIKKDEGFKSIKVEGIDWEEFNKKDAHVEDIKFYVEESNIGNKSGTTLSISSLTHKWTEENLTKLVYELRKLISPISKDDNDFNIYLNLNSFKKDEYEFEGKKIVNGYDVSPDTKNKIEPFPILSNCHYTFEAEYSKNKLSGTLTINDAEIKHFIEVEIDKDVDLGNGLVQLNIFDRDADSLKDRFAKTHSVKGSFSVNEIRRFLNDLSGVAIYRDGFRIRPYGDRDADWLGLNKRRIQNPTQRLEQSLVSGLILVDSEECSGLIERSSREGFEHNDNYDAFKDLLLKALHEVEVRRFKYKTKIGKNRKSQHTIIKSSFSSLREKVAFEKIENFSQDIPEEKQEEFKTVINEHKTSLENLITIIQERQAILEARSTLGFLVAEILHEARHSTSIIGSNLSNLSIKVKKQWQAKIPPDIVKDLLGHFDLYTESINRLENLFKRLDPLINVRRKKFYDFSISKAIKRSLLLYEDKISRLGIFVNHQSPENDLKIHGLEVDLSTAVINLIDNALYWHENRKIDSPFIKISYENDDEYIYILVEDNAGGILEEYQESIFEVGFTMKEEGSGLGLSIARESLGRAGADIRHENTMAGGSLFIIEIRKDT